MHPDTLAYHAARTPADRQICEALAHAIEKHLPDGENRVWHGHPALRVLDLAASIVEARSRRPSRYSKTSR